MSVKDFESQIENRRKAIGVEESRSALQPDCSLTAKVLSGDDNVFEQRRKAQAECELREAENAKIETWERFIAHRGKRYANARLSNFEQLHEKQTFAVDTLTRYCEEIIERIANGSGVLFVGPPGTGKDHLMVALCRAAIFAGRSLRWENGQDLWGNVRDAISDEASEAKMIRGYVSCDVLALSDPLPPRGEMSPHQMATLFRIIDGRYSNLKPTWVTLNVATRLEAEERMGTQIVDRLMHGSLSIVCNWPSYRKAAS